MRHQVDLARSKKMMAIEADDPMNKWREYEQQYKITEEDNFQNRDLEVSEKSLPALK